MLNEGAATTGAKPRREVAALVVCGVVLVMLRLIGFGLPLETDEANYAYIGARLLAGDRLYVDVWDHQPPGAFMLFGAAGAIFGDREATYRGLATAASLASLVSVFLILRRTGGAATATLGAVLFSLASSDPGTAGEGCNREVFMNALILGAWTLLLRGGGEPSVGRVFVAGVLLGAGSLLKTVVVVHWAAAVLMIAVCSGPRGKVLTLPSRRAAWVNAAALAAGPAAIWAAVTAYFAVTGRGGLFLDAVFGFNLGYSDPGEPFLMRFARFFNPPRHPHIFESARAVWVLGAAGAVVAGVRMLRRRAHAREAGVFLLAGAAYVATCLPAQFWPHYYYLMIPPVTMLSAVVASDAAVRIGRRGRGFTLMARALLVLPAACLGYAQAEAYVLATPLKITESRYNSRDFWARAHGLKVRAVTEPEDRVFVYGSDAGVYFYADRRCASRYTMIGSLDARYPGSDDRRRTLIEELRRNRPRLILRTGEAMFPEFDRLLSEEYERIGADHHDHRPGEIILLVYADRRRPVAAIDWEWDRLQAGRSNE
ncbi:MAG: hypothetical protein FLDDKLPJ_03129 [Phycisphaerae bacterium]|nr:hypothetical protein [Phycisphaerae bacterium]